MGTDRLHWADDFDADLHRVVPEARAALGIDAGARLWLLHEPRTDATLVHPACWNDHEAGFVTPVFFTRNDAARSIGPHDRLGPIEVTFDDLWRDAWVHGYGARFGGLYRGAWLLRADRIQWCMSLLMYELRGWNGRPRMPRDILRARSAPRFIAGVRRPSVDPRQLRPEPGRTA